MDVNNAFTSVRHRKKWDIKLRILYEALHTGINAKCNVNTESCSVSDFSNDMSLTCVYRCYVVATIMVLIPIRNVLIKPVDLSCVLYRLKVKHWTTIAQS